MSEGKQESGSTALLAGDESDLLAKLTLAGKNVWEAMEKPAPRKEEMWRVFREVEVMLREATKHHKLPGEDEAYQGYITLGEKLGLQEDDFEVAIDEHGQLHSRVA